MKTSTIAYDYEKSAERIDGILKDNGSSFEEYEYIPSSNSLTHKNGAYVKCTALFVDIRDSSSLPDKHKRPALAKIYRAYISEVVAIMNGNSLCKEIEIEGDCVSGIYDTRYQVSVQSVFSDAARISSLINILNCKLEKKSITKIKVGIGIDYGRALMIRAGYSGSGLNKIVWMGDVVNKASGLCGIANKDQNKQILLSDDIYTNLSEHQKSLLQVNYLHNCYHGNVIRNDMDKWYDENCKKAKNSAGLAGLGFANYLTRTSV